MNYYFIFNNQSPAATYGIGTYVKHLSRSINQMPDTHIVYVDIQAAVAEFTCTRDEQGNTHLQMPFYMTEDGWYNRCGFYYLAGWIRTHAASATLLFHFNYEQHASLAHWLKEEFFDARILFTVHYQLWSFTLKGNRERLRSILSKPTEELKGEEREIIASMDTEKRMFRIADRIIALSQFTRDTLLADYHAEAEKVVCLPNFVEETDMPVAPLPCFNHPALRYLLYVGRLDAGKGTKWLIEAFKTIHAHHPETHLIVIGDGDFSVTRQADGIWEHVSFTGRLPQAALFALYRTAALGIHPSLNEQCSYTLIEMMMHGLPVVSTDCTGITEMFSAAPQCLVPTVDGEDGEAEFVERIANAAERLLNDEVLRKQVSRSLHETYRERYASFQPFGDFLRGFSGNAAALPLGEDLLREMDRHAMALVNKRPDCLDLDFFGMTGLALYMLWRTETVTGEEEHRHEMQEFLIYLIDWMNEFAAQETPVGDIPGMGTLLGRLQKASFYPMGAARLAKICPTEKAGDMPLKQLLRNQLALYNYRY